MVFLLFYSVRSPDPAEKNQPKNEQTFEKRLIFFRRGCIIETKEFQVRKVENGCYLAIDLKSFYASVECVEAGRDPMKTNLVVADSSRTEKTICLAVSPSLKAYGLPGRARLFEVVQRVKEINEERRSNVPGGKFSGESDDADALANDSSLKLGYITARPRMALYMDYSTRIYDIYLRYVAPEDIHIYSVDEVFINAEPYLKIYKMTARQFAAKLVGEVFKETGITATAGIGTNMYLCKIAMDIVAKHIPAGEGGIRIASLDEHSYRLSLWDHKPITDFWRVGKGIAKKLASYGIYTMGDIARCSLAPQSARINEDFLYKLFGINAELLIDHAWGWEPCTMAEIKAYVPTATSISSGQVLQEPYQYDKARLIVKEMTELLTLDLVEKGLETCRIVLTVGYDAECLKDKKTRAAYKGEITSDMYGREVPKHAHGTVALGGYTSSTVKIRKAMCELFNGIVDKKLLVRRINVTACNLRREGEGGGDTIEQLDLFASPEEQTARRDAEKKADEKEKRMQKTVIGISKKYGKNAILKGMNLEEGATAKERNQQIGGHKA